MSTLTQAFDQWATRPADERFTSLQALHDAVVARRDRSIESTRPWDGLRVVAGSAVDVEADRDPQRNTRLFLSSDNGNKAALNSWTVRQLAQRMLLPAEVVTEKLSAELACDVLNYRLGVLKDTDEERQVKILLDKAPGGLLTARALTGEGYTRIWDADITSRLLRLQEQNPVWQPAPAAFDGSRGLYAGDRDLFAFMVDNERRIFETDKHGGLGRGFFVAHSEVGNKAFWLLTFYYEYVCGNHRVWGASGVKEFRIPHVGKADDAVFEAIQGQLTEYADGSALDDELKIKQAKTYTLGKDKNEVLDKVFGLRLISRKLAGEAYDKAVEHEDWYGDPTSAWGFCGGLTEIARDIPNADQRTEVDRAAGKITSMAF
jgi:hypothetical protein